MAFNDDLKTALRFGDQVPGVSDCKIWCMENRLIPFQIKREHRPEVVTTFLLYPIDGGGPYNILAMIPSPLADYLYIRTVSVDGDLYDVIVFNSQENLTGNIASGEYYVLVSDGVDTWYSKSTISIKCYNPGFTEIEEVIITGDELS